MWSVAAAVDAGHGDADGVVGAEHPAGRLGAGDGGQREGGGGGRALQETATSQRTHGGTPFG